MSSHGTTDWLATLRWYIGLSAAMNGLWEILHFPLYTLWTTSSWKAIVFDVAHCTAGDVMIATLVLVAALLALGDPDWPLRGYRRVAIASIFAGLGYTVYSEWLNVVVHKTWGYAPSMPVVPVLGTGLSPLLQWLFVPALSLWLTARRLRDRN